jgi:uncharacterized SAM-binding protein YcdF (DUF218 family)
MAKTVVFVPSYCLTRNQLSLTVMNKEAMEYAAPIVIRENAEIIISTAYEVWNKEAELRIDLLEKLGLSKKQIRVVGGVTNSYGEIQKAKDIILKNNFEKIIIVAEKWHSPRVLKIFQILFPNLGIRLQSFQTSKFEMTYEPSIIKSLRIGWKITWILWNKLLEPFTPLMLKCAKRRG